MDVGVKPMALAMAGQGAMAGISFGHLAFTI